MTFNRRRNGLLKKAYELSILCETQVVVLMFDHKEMCHVYSSEEGVNAHAKMMDKYLTKDFCTVDPIRNYDTSPDLQLDNPAQAVWRVAREKVAVVNTYTVIPNTGTPALGTGRHQGDDEDDDEADGSEQLSVKSSRTYHTKTSDTRAGSQLVVTPALTQDAHSPAERSESPEPRHVQSSPKKAPRRHHDQQHLLSEGQKGLGISGGGFTPLLRPGEQYPPILYPPQPPLQSSYLWQSPDLSMPGAYTNSAQPTMHTQYLPNMGIQYANSQYSPRFQYPLYGSSPAQYIHDSIPPTPLLRQSPKKERAHFNHYTYPPQVELVQRQHTHNNEGHDDGSSPVGHSDHEDDDDDPVTPEYIYANEEAPTVVLPPKVIRGVAMSPTRAIPRTNVSPTRVDTCQNESRSPSRSNRPKNGKQQTFTYVVESPAPAVQIPVPERRVTRSQSRSPQLKARQLPSRVDPDKPFDPPSKLMTPLHLRGPSLLDEITFDPETGAPMMEASALASWLGTTPLNNVSPGHSRETSHVRGESVSQWLNLPQIPE